MGKLEKFEKDFERLIRDVEHKIKRVEGILKKEKEKLFSDIEEIIKELDRERKFLNKEFKEERHIFIEIENLRKAIRRRDMRTVENLARRLYKDLRMFEKIEKHATRIERRGEILHILEDLEKRCNDIIKELSEIKNIVSETHKAHVDIFNEMLLLFKELNSYRDIPVIRSLLNELKRFEKIEKKVIKVV